MELEGREKEIIGARRLGRRRKLGLEGWEEEDNWSLKVGKKDIIGVRR